ncbi:MAG: ATP-dependent zinc metalloprotease FtsH [Anaeroplasmataceae bacterium]|nr:ATP-dependent zinc metalloprotease FtsH [Anaeroplasmataceae bacterium]MDE6415306.1 ATP-dependent zinc metalloprotease FtsH [Anaeroplasmataceae bacterium]
MQDNNQKQNQQQGPGKRFDWKFPLIVIIAIVGIFLFVRYLMQPNPKQLSYTELETAIVDTQNPIDSSTVKAQPASGSNNETIYIISGKFKDGKSFTCYVTIQQFNEITSGENALSIRLYKLETNIFLSLIISLIPYVIMIGFFIFLFRSQGNGKAFDFGKSTARLTRGKSVTFDDVAGCDEEKEELVEIIDFLKNPRKYSEIGARIPKGVLLVGPPGTGKTLLAKAVAGEANVPFFSISGSDFVEMFVGVGASRVRDMFKTAKEHAPCIIFIDEIDAVGRQRGAGMGGGHDEREQTLNQLLVEMDGFTGNLGIIIMAATNRPDVLDPALLRPGRFDRQITISNPDVTGRTAILKVHARNKHLDSSIKLDEIAQRIPGFSGADIENLLNEAALLAARNNRKVIITTDIDEAIDRVIMGPAKKSKKYTERERKLVAFHEAGHAVIGLRLENASVVQKVTIIPRGQAGGYNLMMPKEETYTRSKTEILESIIGYLGGRVAEELVFSDVTTGAHNDFQHATRLARSMVTEYGMSSLGPVQYEQPSGNVFLGRDYLKEKNFSDQIALEIDKEVRRIIEECYAKAKQVISDNLPLLNTIADYLLKVETLTKPDIDEIEATGHLKRYDDYAAAKEAEAKEASSPAENTATPADTEESSNPVPSAEDKPTEE